MDFTNRIKWTCCIEDSSLGFSYNDIKWCRNWVTVHRRDKIDIYSWCVVEYAYSDWGVDLDWVEWDCWSIRYDYEKLVLCDLTWAKVLVEYRTDTSDPLQTRTTRYTYLATNLPYAGNVSDLTDCWSEKLDIQTKQYCDGWETVFGTLVFDVSLGWANPTLLWIVFHKVDWSVHTPVSPVEWACWISTLSIGSELLNVSWVSTLTPTAWAVYAVISVNEWEAWITIDWTTPVVWDSHPAYEWQYVYLQIADELVDFQAIGNPTAKLYVTYYDKPLLLSQI